MREYIATTVEIPTLQRLSPAEKARQRRREDDLSHDAEVEQTREASTGVSAPTERVRGRPRTTLSSDAFFIKVATRLPPDLVEWLKQQVADYRRRNPHAPRLTIEELFRIALVDLRAKGPIDKIVAKYRATVFSS